MHVGTSFLTRRRYSSSCIDDIPQKNATSFEVASYLSEQVHCQINDECHCYTAEQGGIKDRLCMEFRIYIIFKGKCYCITCCREITCDEQRLCTATTKSDHIINEVFYHTQ